MIKGQGVSLIFIKDQKILLMYRLKKGVEYYTFLGGGVEEGETIEQAATREAKEETSLDVKNFKKLWESENQGRIEHYFLIDKFEGSLKVAGPEADRQSKDNVYRLEWVSLEDTSGLNLQPKYMKETVMKELAQ